jgi:hypothetical protein
MVKLTGSNWDGVFRGHSINTNVAHSEFWNNVDCYDQSIVC